MKRIFISYARIDQSFARKLTRALEEVGADVWIDLDDISAGEKWSSAIQHGLDTSHGMLVIVSPDSMASSNVEDEWQYFMDQGRPVIPVLWEPAKMHFQLNRLQYIDFHNRPFGDAFAHMIDELKARGVTIEVEAAEPTRIFNTDYTKTQPAPVSSQIEEKVANMFSFNPMMIGLSVLIIVAIVSGIIYFALDRVGDVNGEVDAAFIEDHLYLFEYEEEPITVSAEPWTVHLEPSADSETDSVSEAQVLSRILQDDIVWYEIEDVDSGLVAYQGADRIPIDEEILLEIVPVHSTLPEFVQLFNEPYTGDVAIDFAIDEDALVHGYLVDADGGRWYLVTVYDEELDTEITGWWHDTDDDLQLELSVSALAFMGEDTNAYWHSDRDEIANAIPSDELVRIFYRTGDLYSVGYYLGDENEWRNVFVPVDTVNVSDPMASTIVTQ